MNAICRSATTKAVQHTKRIPELRDDAIADSLWVTWTTKRVLISLK